VAARAACPQWPGAAGSAACPQLLVWPARGGPAQRARRGRLGADPWPTRGPCPGSTLARPRPGAPMARDLELGRRMRGASGPGVASLRVARPLPCSRRAARRARGLAPGVARSRRVCAACLRRACVVCSQRVQRPARDGPGAACPWCPWPRRVRPCMRLVLARCAQPARPTLFLLYYYYYLLDEIYGLRIERRWIT
jgi:hypothetical protein